MADAFRAMLDELMGKDRDAPLHARAATKVPNFDDPDVCKYELVATCPNQLFKNTRSDLGPCGFGIHADHLDWEAIKAGWDKLDEREKERYGYERDLVRYMDQLVRDMDRKIEKNKERAAAESRPRPLRPDDQRKLDEIKARMDECLQRSMELGETGDVDGSMAMAQQAEVYKRQHEALHKQLTAPERMMSVCDVCGIFICFTDSEQRRLTPGELKAREEHLSGKQYLGWKKIRETLAELTAKRGPMPAGDRDRPAGHGHGSSDRSRSRGEREPGEHPGGRERERSRERGGGGHHSHERERSPGRRGGGGYYDRDRRDYYDRGYDRGGRDYYDRGGRDYDRDYRRDRRY